MIVTAVDEPRKIVVRYVIKPTSFDKQTQSWVELEVFVNGLIDLQRTKRMCIKINLQLILK